jgi:hypothetical protein
MSTAQEGIVRCTFQPRINHLDLQHGEYLLMCTCQSLTTPQVLLCCIKDHQELWIAKPSTRTHIVRLVLMQEMMNPDANMQVVVVEFAGSILAWAADRALMPEVGPVSLTNVPTRMQSVVLTQLCLHSMKRHLVLGV